MDVDGLYALPLSEFVAARGALAKELRAAGRKDDAAAVAALRKPSVAAWAVNQVVRSADLDGLVAAGEALRDAQAALLAGEGDRAAMRAATVAVREAVGALGRAAAELDGVGDAVVERVRETFQAAAVDPEARSQVVGGRLVQELAYSGIAAGVGGSTAPVRPATPVRNDGPEPDRAPSTRTRARRADGDGGAAAAQEVAARQAKAEAARAAAAAERERAAARGRAAKALQAAERAAVTAARVADRAQQERDRAAATLDAAEEELLAARGRAAAARAARDDAVEALERTDP